MKVVSITNQQYPISEKYQIQKHNFKGQTKYINPQITTIVNKRNIILLSLGSAFTAILAFLSPQKISTIKNLISINKKYAKLKKDLPKVQQCFKKVFLRRDLTENETLEILNGYKEIEKRGINLSNEDYAREVFNFAKINYGIKNQSIKIGFKKGLFLGYCNELNSEIVLSNDCLNHSREKIFECIHHELRHAKQNDLVSTLYPEKFEIVAALTHLEEQFSDKSEYWRFIDNLIDRIGAKHCYDPIFTNEVKRLFPFEKIIKENLGVLEPEKITAEERALAHNIANEIGVVIDYNKRAEEVDAFKTGQKIRDLLFTIKS